MMGQARVGPEFLEVDERGGIVSNFLLKLFGNLFTIKT